MIKRIGVLAFIFSVWISMVIPGILIAQEVPSPPCSGCGGVPAVPKPFMIIPPSPLVSPTIPNALEYDGTNLWLTGKNGTRGSVFSGNAPANFNNTVTFGSSGVLDFNTGSVINFADGSVWKSTGLIFGSGTSLSLPDGSSWTSTGLTFGSGSITKNAQLSSPVLYGGNLNGPSLSSPVITGTTTAPFFLGTNTLVLTTTNTNTAQILCIGANTSVTCSTTLPSTVRMLHIRLVGDGAGGGGNNTSSGGGIGSGGASTGGILWNLPVNNGDVFYYWIGVGGSGGSSGSYGLHSCGTYFGNQTPVLDGSQSTSNLCTNSIYSVAAPDSSSAWYLISGGSVFDASGAAYSLYAGGGNPGVTSGNSGAILAGMSGVSNMPVNGSGYYILGSTVTPIGVSPPGNGLIFNGYQGSLANAGSSQWPNGAGGKNPIGYCTTPGRYGFADSSDYNHTFGCGGISINNGYPGEIILNW